MKKLIWSAYVVSLIVLPLIFGGKAQALESKTFLGLEAEVLPKLEGDQKFTDVHLHESESWKVVPESVIKDLPEPNKGQGYSIIPWSELNPDDWLSIHNWMTDRAVKDTIPDWKIRLRERSHHELVGKILQCRGKCFVYRGSTGVLVQHLSQLKEGDEIRTEKDSVAWVYLMEGSLLRLSPETSVSLNELNFSKDHHFILTRLNQGHVYFMPRLKKTPVDDEGPETDSLSLPLLVRDANLEQIERKIYQSKNDVERLEEEWNLHEDNVKDHILLLKNLQANNNAVATAPTRIMMVAPNATIVSQNAAFDFVHLTGSRSWIKKRTTEEGEEFSLHLRGYTDTEVKPLGEAEWFEIEPTGRSYQKVSEALAPLQILELLTRRIRTIEVAREMWYRDFSIPMIKLLGSPELLAREFGYTVWESDLEKRFNFLVEYTRRIETTNLRSVDNLLLKLEEKGESPRKELSEDLYRVSLNHYLLGLKSRYDKSKMRVKEMSDLKYYVWILRNGKF